MSERKLTDVERIANMASVLFGKKEIVEVWMKRPIKSLGGAPEDLALTPEGAEKVVTLLRGYLNA